jgi:hypothetical protein
VLISGKTQLPLWKQRFEHDWSWLTSLGGSLSAKARKTSRKELRCCFRSFLLRTHKT